MRMYGTSSARANEISLPVRSYKPNRVYNSNMNRNDAIFAEIRVDDVLSIHVLRAPYTNIVFRIEFKRFPLVVPLKIWNVNLRRRFIIPNTTGERETLDAALFIIIIIIICRFRPGLLIGVSWCAGYLHSANNANKRLFPLGNFRFGRGQTQISR